MQIWGLALIAFKLVLVLLAVSVLLVALMLWLILRWRRTWP